MWSMRFENLCRRLGLSDAMTAAVGIDPPDLKLDEFDDQTRPTSELLYEVLLDSCDGKAAAILKSSANPQWHASVVSPETRV